MGYFDMRMDDVGISNRKYDLPNWMVAEKMYNCEGFTTTYYKTMFSKEPSKKSPFFSSLLKN